jgi:hypothetical protein
MEEKAGHDCEVGESVMSVSAINSANGEKRRPWAGNQRTGRDRDSDLLPYGRALQGGTSIPLLPGH